MAKRVTVTMDNLYTLRNMPPDTIVRAYKYTDRRRRPPIYPYGYGGEHKRAIIYAPDYVYTEDRYDSSQELSCGRGLNVATKAWCCKDAPVHVSRPRMFVVEFKVSDIVAVPYANDGKFRVKRMRVVKEIAWPKESA